MKNLPVYLLVFIVNIPFVLCKQPFDKKIKKGEIYNPNFQEFQKEDINQIFQILKISFSAIEQKNLHLIETYISEEKGVYVDLKAWKSKKEFIKEVDNPDSYLNYFYLDTQKLQKFTNDNSQISLYDLIRQSQSIRADYYFLSRKDCEVKFTILDNPEESYRFNNPYFIKIKNQWFIYRLF